MTQRTIAIIKKKKRALNYINLYTITSFKVLRETNFVELYLVKKYKLFVQMKHRKN